MDRFEARLFSAQLRQDLPELDLHGLYPNEAIDKIEPFLFVHAANNESTLKIIYGAGTGRLRAAVIDYLQRHPLVVTLHDQGTNAFIFFD